jgi:hypothetical protein
VSKGELQSPRLLHGRAGQSVVSSFSFLTRYPGDWEGDRSAGPVKTRGRRLCSAIAGKTPPWRCAPSNLRVPGRRHAAWVCCSLAWIPRALNYDVEHQSSFDEMSSTKASALAQLDRCLAHLSTVKGGHTVEA